MLHSAGILAGAYRGGRRDLSVILTHAVSDAPIAKGRLKRAYGEALCVAKLDTVDAGAWGSVTAVDCSRCLELLKRINGPTTKRRGYKMLTKQGAEGVLSDLEKGLRQLEANDHAKSVIKTGEGLKDELAKYIGAFETLNEGRQSLAEQVKALDDLLGVSARKRRGSAPARGEAPRTSPCMFGEASGAVRKGKYANVCDKHRDKWNDMSKTAAGKAEQKQLRAKFKAKQAA